MSKPKRQRGKLKFGTRTDRYGQKPTLPVAPWDDEYQDEQKSEGEDEK